MGRIGRHDWGGTCIIDLAGDGGNNPQGVLFRLALPEPMMVAVEISAEIVTAENSEAQPIADVHWQSGRGGQSATVDILPGNVFTVCAAEFLEVKTRFRTEGVVGLSTPATDSATWRVQSTAAPARGAMPIHARFSQQLNVPAAGVVSSELAIPRWAKRFKVLANTVVAGVAGLTNLIVTSRSTQAGGAGTIVARESWLDGHWFTIPGQAQAIDMSAIGTAEQWTATVIWELCL